MNDSADNTRRDINNPDLHVRMRAWRTGENNPLRRKMTLHEAKAILGLSIGYISGLERGMNVITLDVYRKYHAADPDTFPTTDVGMLI